MTDRAMKQLRSHVQPPLWTAAPGRWRWSDGCAVTVEHIHGEHNAATLYHPSTSHQPSIEPPMRDLDEGVTDMPDTRTAEPLRNRELDEPNALVERIAQAVHSHILATEPQTTGADIVAVVRGFIRGEGVAPARQEAADTSGLRLPWLDDIIRCYSVAFARWQEAHRNEATGALTFLGADGPFYGAARSTFDRLAEYRAALSQEPTPATGTEGLDVDDLRSRIDTNLRVYQHRVDSGKATDFDRGKCAAFRVVLSMLEPRGEATFSCGRAALRTPR